MFKYLRILLLSLYWQLPSKGRELVPTLEIAREFRREKRRKKLKRLRQISWKERRMPLHRGYGKSKPKDVRFSNQRKLRRMYRND